MVTLLLVVAVALAIVLVLRRKRARRKPTDAEVLARLRKQGSDLSKPHRVEFFLHFPTRTSAVRAAESVQAAGFSTELGLGTGTEHHVVCATREMVPDKSALADIRARFDVLASSFGGTYEQWTAAVAARNADEAESQP